MSDLIRSQLAQGHDVEALVHQHQKGSVFSSEPFDTGNVYRVPIWGVLVYVPIAPVFAIYLNHILKFFNANVLHLHMPNLSCFWLLLSFRARKIPWVVHWHSDVLGAAPDWKVKILYPIYRIFERLLLSRADKIIVTSPRYFASSKALARFSHKCIVVPLGLSDKPCLLPSAPSNTVDILRLLYVGRLTYYKGQKYLLEAVASLVNNGVSVHLTVVGKGELEVFLKALSDSLGLGDNVNFVGGLSNTQLEDELNNCHLVCLPSIERTEAFGMVLLEAMRASKPCLVTDVPGSGMSWVVQDGVTGVVVKSSNIEALAKGLMSIGAKPELLVEYGINGRARFEKEFTIEKVSEKITSIYKETQNAKET